MEGQIQRFFFIGCLSGKPKMDFKTTENQETRKRKCGFNCPCCRERLLVRQLLGLVQRLLGLGRLGTCNSFFPNESLGLFQTAHGTQQVRSFPSFLLFSHKKSLLHTTWRTKTKSRRKTSSCVEQKSLKDVKSQTTLQCHNLYFPHYPKGQSQLRRRPPRIMENVRDLD